eukprot:398868_1
MGSELSTQNVSNNTYTDKWHIHETYQPLPTHKLHIPSNEEIESMNERPCIIFYNGTFAPIHYGHINALTSAKKYLQSNGFYVMGAYMSPCWNGYCLNKMKMKNQPYISHYHRLNLINLSINHLNWAMIDTNECFANKFYYPTDTIMQLYKRILHSTTLKQGQFDIIWLFGIDLGFAKIPNSHKTFLRTICIDNRQQDKNDQHFIKQITRTIKQQNEQHINNIPSNQNLPIYMYCKCDPLKLSSTKIRDSKSNQLIEMFKQYNMQNVADYIIKHNIYSCSDEQKTDTESKNDIEIKDLNNNTNGIDIFRQILLTKGIWAFSQQAVENVLSPEILTEYMRKSKYLGINDKIVSFESIKAGKNGFRGTAFRLFNFYVCMNGNNHNQKQQKNWEFFLKIGAQRGTNKDSWLIKNEYMFYKDLYLQYKDSYCYLPVLIFCDYVKCNYEHDEDTIINIICTQDLTNKVIFPEWYQDLGLSKLVMITRSLAEFHAKSFHENNKMQNIIDNKYKPMHFTDKKYINWVETQALLGENMFKSAFNGVKTLNKSQMEFISKMANNVESILNELCNLCKQVEFESVIHGDAFITNILLPKDDNKENESKENENGFDNNSFGIMGWNYKRNDIDRCVFIDWQTYVIGCPFFDLISLFDGLLIECGSELEQKLFICYLDYLMRFGVDLKGLNNFGDTNVLS